MNTIMQKVRVAFVTALRLPTEFQETEIVYNQFVGWDSIGHMTVVAALEEQFDCMLEMDDILDMNSYAKALEIMAKYA